MRLETSMGIAVILLVSQPCLPAWAQSAAPDSPVLAAEAVAPAVETVVPLSTEAEVLMLCEAFLQRVTAGSFEEAFALIRPYFPVSEARITTIESETRQQLGMAQLQFGQVVGHNFMNGETVQDSILRFRFLQRFERDAIFWEFVFYRPRGTWQINALGFDDEIRDLFK
jgi:hypothetical protein